MNAAASGLRYVAECSKLSLREVTGPSKGVEQHGVSNLWFARQAELQSCTWNQAPKSLALGHDESALAMSEAKRNPIRRDWS